MCSCKLYEIRLLNEISWEIILIICWRDYFNFILYKSFQLINLNIYKDILIVYNKNVFF